MLLLESAPREMTGNEGVQLGTLQFMVGMLARQLSSWYFLYLNQTETVSQR